MKILLTSLLLYSSINGISNHSTITPSSQQTVLASTYTQIAASSSNANITNDTNASTNDIQTFMQQAQKVINQETKKSTTTLSLNENPNNTIQQDTYGIVDYYKLDTDKLYFYEQRADQKPIVKVVPLSMNANIIRTASANTIPDGFGGRALINSSSINSSGDYIETRVTNISMQRIPQAGSTAYIYTGFNQGSFGVDAGIQYSPNDAPGVWQPYLKLSNTGPVASSYLLKPYNQVQSSNGYVPNQPIQMDVWKNYTSSETGENNAIRLKLVGTAICTDLACSHHQQTKLMSIFSKSNVGVTKKVDNYKLLATVAGANATGSFSTTISDIAIDGVPKTPTRDATDNTTMTISGNQVSYTLNK
ncbi:hypothetical protein L2089_00700 [Paenibacillus hunanensis]|uniref:YrpD family protein n=1 Tax=Paenibacillus hunanensis TaxID=539262 RepID=UPI002026BC27|nr:YrpD family protein [Paenibacillus hunanensis]MCL9659189.1 hypothetical protein [Paenibacillus hunanensis]